MEKRFVFGHGKTNKIKLNGEEVQKIQNVNGKVKLEFKTWEIITIAFTNNL